MATVRLAQETAKVAPGQFAELQQEFDDQSRREFPDGRIGTLQRARDAQVAAAVPCPAEIHEPFVSGDPELDAALQGEAMMVLDRNLDGVHGQVSSSGTRSAADRTGFRQAIDRQSLAVR